MNRDEPGGKSLDDPTLWPDGIYRRRIRLDCGHGRCHAMMEDEQHHLGVRLDHDGKHITGVDGAMIRVPWTACPGATAELQALVGRPLDAMPDRIDGAERREQCTHLLDLVLLLAPLALKGEASRTYAADVGRSSGRRFAQLKRDGATVERWQLEDQRIVDHPLLGEVEVPDLPRRLRTLTPPPAADMVEAMLVLRRAVHVAPRDAADFETPAGATPLDYGAPPTCYSYQTRRAGQTVYVPNSIRNFTHQPEAMLGRWASFQEEA